MKPTVVLCIIFLVVKFVKCTEDLYKILGINKSATKKEIKVAYKKLAMEWHPDRNDDPSANDKFMKINEAYETLSDPDKKQEYDRFGKTSSSMDQNQRQGGFRGGDPFSSFFGGNFGHFKFDFGAGGGVNDDLIDKMGINYRIYMDKILPDSYHKPSLIYVYADFCMRCMHVDRVFDKIVNDMDNIGMGVGTAHANIHRQLSHKLRIDTVPTILIVIDGRVQYMKGVPSVPNIRDFVRSVIPSNIVDQINDANVQSFLDGWPDNRVRMLFCDSKPDPSLRYLLPVFANKQRFAAGYVNTRDAASKQLLARYRIQPNMETLLLFNEETAHPAAQVGMAVLARSTIDELMESTKHLLLPRLSSQQLLDELCPAYTSVKRKSLCVVLLTQNTPSHDAHRTSLRHYAQSHRVQNERVKYTYIYQDTQTHFVNRLTADGRVANDSSGALKMAILWREEPQLVHFDWLENGWYAEGPEVEDAHTRLALLVNDMLSSKSPPPFSVGLSFDLYNEHGYKLPYRMYLKLCDWYDVAIEKLYSFDEVTMVMVITSLMCLGLVWMMLRNMLEFDDTPASRNRGRRQGSASGRYDAAGAHVTAAPRRPVVNITPLVAENFDHLVLKQEPGVRVLVLFVDDRTKMKLIKQFATSVTPFARSKAFVFAFLQLEDNLNWFIRLLEETVDGATRDLSHINMRNCLGTVLALNGPRKSYSIYHAHTEQLLRTGGAGDVSSALGLDDDHDDVSDNENEARQAERLLEQELLTKLQLWLERLCEGTVKKFKIDQWPQMDR